MKNTLLSLVFCSVAANLSAGTPATDPDRTPPPLDPANMDTSVQPGDDFYRFANGGWIKANPIPPEFSRWGSFDELSEKNVAALKEVADKTAAAAAKAKPGSDEQKVGDYYATGMDEAAVNSARLKPLADELKRIDAIKERGDILKEVAHLHQIGVGAFFRFGASQDDKNSEQEIAVASQGGLALPDRDYYTKDDEGSKKLREQYVAHIAKMFSLAGHAEDVAQKEAAAVLALETSLAVPAMTRVAMRDPNAVYHKMKAADVQALTPTWKWNDYFKGIDLAVPAEMNVQQPDFFKAADQVFANTSIDDWKTYLRWHVLHAAAPRISDDFVNENFQFNDAVLKGVKQLKPRWKRVVADTDSAVGEALGKLYVADHFPPEAKARALEMVNNLRAALADRIKAIDWMDEPTKEQALKKLAAFNVKIGYPDKWRDYSALKIDRSSFLLNAERASQFEVHRRLSKIGKPVDRTEWGMTPPTVNAYYNAKLNEIVFPAGILQPPFFDPKADDAVNYGGMGAVIGHEMTHGFDDRGRQYDAVGNLRDWWTPASAEAYKKRSEGIVAQYSAYEPLPGLHVNGALTQGENIADIGGVKIAYSALQKALASKQARPEKIDGFTPEQRFFLAYAQIWRNNQRDEDLKLRLNTDPHSPGQYRTNGPLSNFQEFADAFQLPADAKVMRAPQERVNIW